MRTVLSEPENEQEIESDPGRHNAAESQDDCGSMSKSPGQSSSGDFESQEQTEQPTAQPLAASAVKLKQSRRHRVPTKDLRDQKFAGQLEDESEANATKSRPKRKSSKAAGKDRTRERVSQDLSPEQGSSPSIACSSGSDESHTLEPMPPSKRSKRSKAAAPSLKSTSARRKRQHNQSMELKQQQELQLAARRIEEMEKTKLKLIELDKQQQQRHSPVSLGILCAARICVLLPHFPANVARCLFLSASRTRCLQAPPASAPLTW